MRACLHAAAGGQQPQVSGSGLPVTAHTVDSTPSAYFAETKINILWRPAMKTSGLRVEDFKFRIRLLSLSEFMGLGRMCTQVDCGIKRQVDLVGRKSGVL